MSVIDALKPKPKDGASVDIGAKIEALDGQVRALQRQLEAAALASVESGDEKPYRALLAEIDNLEVTRQTLLRAQAGLAERARQDEIAKAGDIRKHRLNAMRGHQRERRKAAVKLAAALENVAIAYRELVQETNGVSVSFPDPIKNGDELSDAAYIDEAVQFEAWRALGRPSRERQFPPIGHCPLIEHRDNPNGAPKLIDLIANADRHVARVLGEAEPANE